MRYSIAVRIRKDRPNKKGCASVNIQVLINSERAIVPLNIVWPVDFFDNKKGVFLERFKGDQEANDFNMEALKISGQINEILIWYRHSDRILTVKQLYKELKRYGARENFVTFWSTEANERYNLGRISNETWRSHMCHSRILERYQSVVRFNELDKEYLERFEAWLRHRCGYNINTVWAIMKDFKSYARRANEQGISVNIESVSKFRLPRPQARITYLKPAELAKLEEYYRSATIREAQHQVLRYFLFSCYTGVRHSDISVLSWANIDDDMLDFEPKKTSNLQKRVRVPLAGRAFNLIQNRKGRLFDCFTDQANNRLLKDIGIECGIRKNITYHVSRHTFATEFLRRGGAVQVLQKLLGHRNIETTMIYVHVNDDDMREQMKVFEESAPAG